MRNGILTIMKKELARFFGDKRMAFTTILLPGLMIYFMYNFMGSAIGDMVKVDETYKYSVNVVNLPESVKSLSGEMPVDFMETDAKNADNIKQAIENKACDLFVIFPENFSEEVAAYEPYMGKAAPNVEIYYNSASKESSGAFAMMTGMLDQMESMMANKFDVNAGETKFDLATKEDTTGSVFAAMLPMLLIIFLFTGSMAVATESIAGEKERGTIATMLITPVKRSDIAVGKITALSIIALLSGISSTIGLVLSLPKLMGAASDEISSNVYTVSDYMLLAVVVLSTVLVIVTAISIISTFAKTIKEAQTFVTPVMIVGMLVGITAMFGSGAKTELFYYLIPLYNSVQCMIGIFSFTINPMFVAVTVISNLIYSAIGVFILARMFNSERIIYSK